MPDEVMLCELCGEVAGRDQNGNILVVRVPRPVGARDNSVEEGSVVKLVCHYHFVHHRCDLSRHDPMLRAGSDSPHHRRGVPHHGVV